MVSLQALSDRTPDDSNKNKGIWNMVLGEYYWEEKDDKTKAEQCFKTAGAMGIPEAYSNIASFYSEKEDWYTE